MVEPAEGLRVGNRAFDPGLGIDPAEIAAQVDGGLDPRNRQRVIAAISRAAVDVVADEDRFEPGAGQRSGPAAAHPADPVADSIRIVQ